MLYRIIEKFGPGSGEAWVNYAKWRGLSHLTCFDSVDRILKPSLFTPVSSDDWDNCCKEDSLIDLITNIEYAKIVLQRYKDAEIVGLEVDIANDYSPKTGFLGYDIIDGYGEVSLLTNCGADPEKAITPHMSDNALILDLPTALKIKSNLRESNPEDPHASACSVWAIYKV